MRLVSLKRAASTLTLCTALTLVLLKVLPTPLARFQESIGLNQNHFVGQITTDAEVWVDSSIVGGKPTMPDELHMTTMSSPLPLEEKTAVSGQDLLSSIDLRGKWQQDQVHKFCSTYQYLNTNRNRLLHDTHFIFNEERKFLFCFVPKVGCTYMKEFLFVLAGVIPESKIAKEMVRVPHGGFHIGLSKYSFKSKNVSSSMKLRMIESYWKFTIVRNPLERLVSAFRSKLSGPLRTRSHEPQFEHIKQEILRKYDNQTLKLWQMRKDSLNATIDFEMYVKWIVSKPNTELDHHFRPIHLITQPCAVGYNFYGSFSDMTSDMHLTLDKLSIPKKLYRDHGYYGSGQNTTALLMQYYSTLSADLKLALFEDFKVELDFYYHLFPDERYSHVTLLGIDKDI